MSLAQFRVLACVGTGAKIRHGSESSCEDEDFSKFKVDDLKTYLRERGIQLSDRGKGKRKAELLDLCEKAAAMKQAKLDDAAEDLNKLIETADK